MDYPNEGGKAVCPQNGMSISLSCVLVGAGCAATWLCRGCSPAPRLFVCLFVCLSALGLVGGRGASFGARTGPNDSGERDLQKVKEK